jgi:glycosyltransferase involved in cell wall biosynthesis
MPTNLHGPGDNFDLRGSHVLAALMRKVAEAKRAGEKIFVIDSFSKDATVDLAKGGGAQVLQHLFQNNACQFEWALDNAPITSEWVMRLDADEIIEADLAAEITAKLPTLPEDVTGVNLNRKTIFQNRFIRFGGRYPLTLLRIWRRGKAALKTAGWTSTCI